MKNIERESLLAQTRRRISGIEAQRRDAEINKRAKQVRQYTAWIKYLHNILEFLMDRSLKEHKSKTVYISGKITGDINYTKKFAEAEKKLLDRGWRVLNPAKLPGDFEYEQYYPINCAMIDGADAIYMLRDFKESLGAVAELLYAGRKDIEIIFEREEIRKQEPAK